MCRATKEPMEPIRISTPNPALRATGAALAIASALVLAACVAVPVDFRTGQPLVWPPAASNPTAPREAVAVAAPMAPAPAVPLTYTARLYPINDVANRAGMLTAVVTDGHGGRGSFALSYLGEAMQGEATRVEAGHPGFGRIHREVLGLATVQVQGRRCIANAFGARGINAQCEYVLSAPSQGTGACLFSDGARYQLHFG
jgi:hypothetical protein